MAVRWGRYNGVSFFGFFFDRVLRTGFNFTQLFYRIFVLYFCLPETENRTLEDIEIHFTDNSKKFYDINIVKISKKLRDCGKEMDTENGGNVKGIEMKKGCDNKAFEQL